MIVTLEVVGTQGLLEMVHAKTLFPKPNPVMVVLGISEFVMTPLPEINDHAPVPKVAIFAAIVAVVPAHKV